jgi:SAM-dependent methyltransferase
MTRHSDGSAGDANYAAIGGAYATYRQPEPQIAAFIHRALGDAKTVLNVGAGAGSYEPTDRTVTPVEPSESMRAQRPAGLASAIDATAEALPFADQSFDAAMTTFSIHQWRDLAVGLRELRRVTRGPVVILTCDPDLLDRSWVADYLPAVIETEARRYPTMAAIGEALGEIDVAQVPIPLACVDGFTEAYYGRPEMLLDPLARLSNSAWSFVDEDTVTASMAQLQTDLEDGAWDAKYGSLRTQPTFEGSLVLVVSRGTQPSPSGTR